MLLNIAEQTVAMELEWISDSVVTALTVPYMVHSSSTVDAFFSIPKEVLEQKVEAFEGEAKARCEFSAYGSLFYSWMLPRGGFCLHSSAIAYKGMAYLFSASSGTGKSTHAHLWAQAFPGEVCFINDDRPILYNHHGVWKAYGAPWCGKDDLGANICAPIGGICYLMRGTENNVRRIDGLRAFTRVFSQTPRPRDAEHMDALIRLVEDITARVPIYELTCTQTLQAAIAARDGICKDAERDAYDSD